MCTSKMAIKINKPIERENDFKIPKYVIRDWDTKGYSEMLVKCGTCYYRDWETY